MVCEIWAPESSLQCFFCNFKLYSLKKIADLRLLGSSQSWSFVSILLCFLCLPSSGGPGLKAVAPDPFLAAQPPSSLLGIAPSRYNRHPCDSLQYSRRRCISTFYKGRNTSLCLHDFAVRNPASTPLTLLAATQHRPDG